MNSMKKIAIIIPELARPGGAEKVAFDLMQEFNRRNYAVTVIRFDKLDPSETAYEVQGEDKHLNIPNRQGGVWVQMHLLLLRAWCFWRIFHKEKFDHIFCCGPEVMMKAVAGYANQNNINCEVSLENTMACGIGACLCCVTDTKEGHKCVCTEGPIFNIKDLKWQI